MRFVAASTQKVGLNRLHLHLTSASPEGQRATVEKALSIGGCHLDVGQLPEEGHVVLSDPGDNEFCVSRLVTASSPAAVHSARSPATVLER